MKGLAAYADPILVASFSAAVQVGYVTWGYSPPEAFSALIGIAFGFSLILWMVTDASRRGCTPFFDFGFLAYITLPISLPWYLVRTRGWLRGLLVLLFVAALWLVPGIIALIAWQVLYGEFADG